MGNRAVITTAEDWKYGGIGIYLHWYGGRDCVEAFLEYCRLRGFPEGDYGLARLVQVIANYIGGGDGIGIDTLWRMDCNNGDNGVYIIENWQIVNRVYEGDDERRIDDNEALLREIDRRQPEAERIGEGFWDAEAEFVGDLQVGDRVYVQHFDGRYRLATVMGRGGDRMVNGQHVAGLPYVDLYGRTAADRQNNINNYLERHKMYRRAK